MVDCPLQTFAIPDLYGPRLYPKSEHATIQSPNGNANEIIARSKNPKLFDVMPDIKMGPDKLTACNAQESDKENADTNDDEDENYQKENITKNQGNALYDAKKFDNVINVIKMYLKSIQKVLIICLTKVVSLSKCVFLYFKKNYH
ncbi:hypothetical protein RFI_02726 [Reticulomyxa filosa]|uniref:Uncharacterized protein n=1 Tax=Reticulomyxa filosa TaxID=46433 RepID=X6P8F2_RETFI|nr:hypothetical protein RFI_02726 [Reticulomyxa filosa]|eukprot:ETO34373.1 hypothetical protein RFI_02726 [Reticulomyxa filosa]